MPKNRPSRVRARTLLRAGAGCCATLILAAGCSPVQHVARQHGAQAVTGKQKADPPKVIPTLAPPLPEIPAKVLYWGSFFGKGGGNFALTDKPVAITLPGPVAEVASSNSTEYALLKDGRLFAWGLGNDGQLGDGKQTDSLTQPVEVRFPPGVKIAWLPTDAMPYNTGLAVDTSGHVWGWGKNSYGELCTGTKEILTPRRLSLSGITALAGASNHVLYDSDGALYSCGQNLAGDLGDGRYGNSTTPMRVVGLDGGNVTKLYASFANSGALLADGKYYDWGYNGEGQLGDGNLKESDVPVLVHLPGPVVEAAQGGSIWVNGQTVVKLANGSTWGWGDNWAGQLGTGTTRSALLPVPFSPPKGVTYMLLSTGSATSYAVSKAGYVFAWGIGRLGQMGSGSYQTAMTPVLVAQGASGISATANNVVINTPGA